jgi:integrase
MLAQVRDAAPGPDGFVFVGVKSGQLRRSNFSKPWAQALAKAGLPDDLHVHDLRHTVARWPPKRVPHSVS